MKLKVLVQSTIASKCLYKTVILSDNPTAGELLLLLFPRCADGYTVRHCATVLAANDILDSSMYLLVEPK